MKGQSCASTQGTLCSRTHHQQAGGDRWILFDECEGRDMYHHGRFECKLYNIKYRDTGKPVCGNAEFLVKLDQERMK